ncbi:MAG: hypothetical protein HPY83_14170 [Anaerolineae bacterium]|nr:hypothetical protein [Anaerolineae bacterium]
MLRIAAAVLLGLHGLVHLLYLGQSQRLFQLQPGMVWPDGSWAFSRLAGEDGTRLLASVFCVAAAIGFVASGTGLLARQSWWRPTVVGSAVLSAAMVLLFWNGRMERLSDQGGIAPIIHVAILIAVLVLQWPESVL